MKQTRRYRLSMSCSSIGRQWIVFCFGILGIQSLFSQTIRSVEWISRSPRPAAVDGLIGKEIGSKDFSNSIKLLKSIQAFSDLEFKLEESGKLVLTARDRVLMRQIEWKYPKDLPGFVRSDLESQLALAEGDALPEDIAARVSRLSARLKARGYQDLNLTYRLTGPEPSRDLILEFPKSGSPRELYRKVEFQEIRELELLREISKKFFDLNSMNLTSWTQESPSLFFARNAVLRDEVDFEEFKQQLRRQMRSRGYLNFELQILAISDDRLSVIARNVNRFDFQFEGQSYFWESELRNLLLENLSDRAFDVEEAKLLIMEAYTKKGFQDVMVETELKTQDSGLRVEFDIREGKQTFFKGVEFRNVRADTLPLLMEAESKWIEPFRSPFRNTFFDQKGLESTLGVLVEGIRAKGFLDVEVADYSFSQAEGSRFGRLLLSLRLGPRYKYSDFQVRDSEGRLSGVEAMRLPVQGEFFDGDHLIELLREIKDAYASEGYLYAEIDTNESRIFQKNPLLNTVAATVSVTRGPQVYLRNIIVNGNVRTKKKVVLRELGGGALDLGEKVSPEKIRDFETRLLGTGLFSSVDLKPVGNNIEVRGDRSFVDYEVNLKERAGGAIELGPGFRTDLGIVGFGEFSYRNLGGWNRGIFTKAQVSHKLSHFQFLEQQYSAAFLEPYPLEYRLKLRLDARYILDDDIQYEGDTPIKGFNTEETSASAKIEKKWTSHFSTTLTLYQYSLPRIFRIISSTKSTQKYRLGGNGLEFLLDFRDNIFNTLKGFFISEELEYFSPYLASNRKVNFIKSKTRYNHYFHLGKEAVFAFSFGYEHLWGLDSDAVIPENKRLTLGGRSSLRSLPENFLRFDEQGVAEQRALLGRFEYRVPLFSGWGVASFYEAGEIDVLRDVVGTGKRSTGLRHGAGFGIRYKTPVGPLSVDWAYNFNARSEEDDYQISLSVGAF